ncbi:restriction endonuclease subunit S [Lactobacillus delbrueckii]|uniref:restriction endonuclease subunit S n=1 Tax=Lactobacillus delbrueckii TaxID=1584 RepID=UPI001F33DFD2|nr:restriction endonuclease subunit S [Lactobacillus delbrueckii]MDK8262213.1 restriction endonuclease subunit S [Lactobacillus delbrueckii]GHN16395.1 type I restriction-modification system specificity subunit S [Lactobacillus delbrueckii]GHN49268.1 type I restriction-modification system specificity subunit S [Lactobacillus delbrueckii]
MKDEKKAPKLRFKSFTDDWEQCKLGDVYGHLYSGNTPSRKNSANFGGDTPWIRTADLNNGLIKSTTEFLTYEGIKQLKILPENTIVLAMYGGFNQIGRTGILGFPATINQALVALTPHKNINQFFAQSYLNRHIIDWRRVAASSRKDPNITKEDVEKSEFSFGSLEEQNRISKLISRLDHTITLHEGKKRQLELLKSALLQKMFADENGYPSVRFREFSDVWQLKKFKEVYAKSKEKNTRYGIQDIISVANMHYNKNASIRSVEYLKTYNVFKIGDIAFEGNKSSRFSHGRFVENTIGDGIVSHVFDVFRPIDKHDLQFMKHYINCENVMGPIMLRVTKASTMMTNLVAKDFLNESIRIPSISEQQHIGRLLECLNQLITMHQNKLNNLKILKNSLLQNMFI